MDPLAGVFDDALKKKIYDDLADTMISAMERGEMLYEESQESSRFVLERLDNVSTYQELLSFLEELSSKWKIYQPVLLTIKTQEQQQNEAGKIADITSNLTELTNS